MDLKFLNFIDIFSFCDIIIRKKKKEAQMIMEITLNHEEILEALEKYISEESKINLYNLDIWNFEIKEIKENKLKSKYIAKIELRNKE